MDQEPETPADDPREDDPELAALLTFEPVPRKQSRAGGWWSPENQRTFIRVLVATGDYRQAAAAVELTANSAYQLRKEAHSDDFRRAWEEAVALHRKRNPATPRQAREVRGAPLGQADMPALEDAEKEALLAEILQRYGVKLHAERQARLEGRIVEADFYVRQLAMIEMILDLGGRTQEVLESFRRGDFQLPQAVATPGATLLEKLRRAFWLEKGEADRPPPAPLGSHSDAWATGRDDYDPARHGDRADWERRQAEKRRLAAEAQQAWEERARREAEPDNDGSPGGEP